MKISVIVPFLNEEKYIEQCVKSLINQKFPKKDYEIIFIDNGSTDSSLKIVKKYKNVKLLKELKIKGCYAPRNKGIKTAKGKIFAFTDADCELSKNWLKEISNTFKDKKVIALIGKRKNANNNFFLKIYEDYENTKAKFVTNKLAKKYRYAYGNNMAIRREVFDKTGPFAIWPPTNGDDEIIQRISNLFRKKKFVFAKKVILRHLEVDNVLVWYKKYRSYGYNDTLLEGVSTYRRLKLKDNISIYFELIKQHEYSLTKSLATLPVLFIGTCMYKYGSLKTFLKIKE